MVVTWFLILSGISQELSWTNKYRASTFRQYFTNRLLRIYPLYILSLVFTYILAVIYYGDYNIVSLGSVFGHLVNIQDLNHRYSGIWVNTFLNNTSLWFISYVWWSYMLFYFCKKHVSSNNQLLCAALISLMGVLSFNLYQNPISHILSYFLVFWSGVEIGKIYLEDKTLSLSKLRPVLYYLLILLLSVTLPIFIFEENFSFYQYPVIEIRHYLYTIIGVILSLLWIYYGHIGKRYILQFAIIAPYSYALFLIHYPFVVEYNLFSTSSYIINILLALLFTTIVSVILTSANNRFIQSILKRQ